MASTAPPVVVRGVPKLREDDVSAPRRSVLDLVNDKYQWSLYVQAIADIMDHKHTPSEDPLSWFSIGGIHGLPKKPWSGVPHSQSFFCEHGTLLFPTWHRAYLALFEQALVGAARRIATKYDARADAEDWLSAGDKLRAPYWDWSGPDKNLPNEYLEGETLEIDTPTGINKNFPNPLLRYNFSKSEENLLVEAWNEIKERRPDTELPRPGDRTVRYPDAANPADAFRKELKKELGGSGFGEVVRKALLANTTWEKFSNTTSNHNQIANSLEEIHNNIHDLVGGGGYMAFPEYAGFDPIFWLHHANVDRVLSTWQSLWGGWVSGTPIRGRDAHSELKPFRDTPSTMWRSEMDPLKGTAQLNYHYDLLVKVERSSGSHATRPLSKVAVLDRFNQAFSDGTQSDELSLMALDSPLTDLTVRIRGQSRTVGTPYRVSVYLGNPPASSSDWNATDDYVGSHFEFVNSNQEECENCRENPNAVTEGFVSLVSTLQSRGLYDQDDAKIDDYLKKNLQWRIRTVGGRELQPQDIQGFEVAVLSARSSRSISEVILEAGETNGPLEAGLDVSYRNVTYGLPGGWKADAQ